MDLRQQDLEALYEKVKPDRRGEVASYIPELLKVPEDHFAIAVAGVDGRSLKIGDADHLLTLQSLSKPFVYALALQDCGEKLVHNKVGVEPTGEAFNSIIELEEKSHRPFNPMINSGAIATTSLIRGETPGLRRDRILQYFARFVGHPVAIDQAVFESEKKTGHRNRAIAHLMRNFAILEGDVEATLDLYFQQCSILMNTQDLARMGSVLANGGVCPHSQVEILPARHVQNVLSLMMTCGMYDTSGRWVFDVGLPAKSGVSGVVMAVIPGVGAVAVSSPRLDAHGHSVRGVEVIQRLAESQNLNMFMPKVPVGKIH